MTAMPEQACCAGCGVLLGRRQGTWCPCCRQERQAAPCPGCGGIRLLLPGTGRCATCSRTCADCGKVVRPRDRDRCSRCHRRAEPSRACQACGKLTVIVAHGLCDNCWQQDPARLAGQVERLAARLGDPPAWLGDFAAHAAARHCVGRTSLMISRLGRLLAEAGTATPQALLEKASRPGRPAGTLARALEDFFTDAGLAFPADHAARREAARRQRRVEETPEPLQPALAHYATALATDQQRARRAGTRPRSDRTLTAELAVLRDLARFLTGQRAKTDWATVQTADLEAFLALRPASRARRLTTFRSFFRWARASRLILADPAAGIRAGRTRGYHPRTLAVAEQRRCSAAGPPTRPSTRTRHWPACWRCCTPRRPGSCATSRSPTSTPPPARSGSGAGRTRSRSTRPAGRRCSAASNTASGSPPATRT